MRKNAHRIWTPDGHWAPIKECIYESVTQTAPLAHSTYSDISVNLIFFAVQRARERGDGVGIGSNMQSHSAAC